MMRKRDTGAIGLHVTELTDADSKRNNTDRVWIESIFRTCALRGGEKLAVGRRTARAWDFFRHKG